MPLGTRLPFLLSATRDAEAAKRFARQSAARHGGFSCWGASDRGTGGPTHCCDCPNTTKSAPRVINVDKNAAYPKAEAFLKVSGMLPESVELKPGQILE